MIVKVTIKFLISIFFYFFDLKLGSKFGLTFLCRNSSRHNFKARVCCFFILHQRNPWKIMENVFHLIKSGRFVLEIFKFLWFSSLPNVLRFKEEVENRKSMTWNSMQKLPSLSFGKSQNPFRIKTSKIAR